MCGILQVEVKSPARPEDAEGLLEGGAILLMALEIPDGGEGEVPKIPPHPEVFRPGLGGVALFLPELGVAAVSSGHIEDTGAGGQVEKGFYR
jgi:hypothetical protein